MSGSLGAWAPSEDLLQTLVAALRTVASCEVVPIPTPRALLERTEDIALAVLFAPHAMRDAVWPRFQELGHRRSLLVIGSEPPSSVVGVTMWLPALPPQKMLGSIIEQLLVEGPSGSWPPSLVPPAPSRPPSVAPPSWRRKTDMILGDSEATRRLLRDLERLAGSKTLVLVTGESGTGKELVARALHYCGPRSSEPFIALNCAAIPENLVEAELFGYERGAFTGAVATRTGAFEAAKRGTLFLDEIGEMPKMIQPKLLRILETNEFSRVGSTETRPVDARIVVATNRDLLAAVKEGRFREDLYYRLNVYPIRLEPLRNRPEDTPALIGHHLGLIAARENRPTPRLTPAALERLLAYSWPGNVRELVHILTRAMIVAPSNVIEAEHIDLPGSGEHVSVARYRDAKQAFEHAYYSRLLRIANGNVALAARLADKTRKEVYDALKRVGLDAGGYRQGSDADDA